MGTSRAIEGLYFSFFLVTNYSGLIRRHLYCKRVL
nr:MAG TPA: hypothetical protein [Caudoviricetes sp.]